MYPSSSPVSQISWFPTSSSRSPSILVVQDASNCVFLYEQCFDSSFPLFQLRESFSSPGGLLTWVLSKSSMDDIKSNNVNISTDNNPPCPTAVSRFQGTMSPSLFQSWKSEEGVLLLYANSTVHGWLLRHRPPSSLQESSLSVRSFSLPLKLDSTERSTLFAQMAGDSCIRLTRFAGGMLTTVDAVRRDALQQTSIHSQCIGNDSGLTRIVESPRNKGNYLTVDDRHRFLFWSEHVVTPTNCNP